MRRALAGLATLAALLVAAGGTPGGSDVDEIERVASRWVAAVAGRDPALGELLSRSARAHYPRLRDLALYADAQRLETLDVTEQLEVLLLRHLSPPEALRRMDESELLLLALREGFFGLDLRASDQLRETVVAGDSARGRLYKFGRDDRPDRGLQHFVREAGRWRVTLRGELERRRADFDALVARSGLSESELAFFVLEMRLLRKVAPRDFAAPFSKTPPDVSAAPRVAPSAPRVAPSARPVLRVVAIRHALDSTEPPAATIEDRVESLRYVLEPGDPLPSHPGYRLLRVGEEVAVLDAAGEEQSLRLLPDEPLGRRVKPAGGAHSLLSRARQGAQREGLMAQWRNAGLRERPLLLQQGSLTPVHESEIGDRISGLRVRELARGSFWRQLGLREGDLLTSFNQRSLDSLDAWQEWMEVAQNERTITITLQRAAQQLRYRIRTIRPR